ncbi:hypothetical protein [Sphingomonas azotifigens]|uniref:hypothetical protein n=1 Tax=Sphingomonas azotifigens TaxID=330920 RepID=UPI000A03E8B1|nr:hypothetical protein [Sphingomonas azotifigens]
MKVTVEIQPNAATAAAAPAAGAVQLHDTLPADATGDLSDGGAGPGGSGGITPAPQGAEMDGAGPPPALLDAIAAAERASPNGPALPLAGDPGSDALVDGGAGPATL